MGQAGITLSYQLRAEDATGNLLTNYTSSYGSGLTPSYVAENADAGNGVVLSSRFASGASLTAIGGGILQLSSAAASFSRQASTAPDGPYTSLQFGLDITDSFDARSLQTKNMNAATTGTCSGASCTTASLGSPVVVRYGRLRLDDAFGPETFPLPVNFATEYWTGNHFSLNTSDSCTLVPRSAISYPAGSIAVDANRTVSLTGGSTLGTYTNLTATDVKFGAGTAGQQFTAPSGGTGRFVVRVDLTNLPWLRFDWNQDGNYSDVSLPNANFEFGSYRGNDRIIYWRERLQ
jgi:MSHA biogenesis protein MshQ